MQYVRPFFIFISLFCFIPLAPFSNWPCILERCPNSVESVSTLEVPLALFRNVHNVSNFSFAPRFSGMCCLSLAPATSFNNYYSLCTELCLASSGERMPSRLRFHSISHLSASEIYHFIPPGCVIVIRFHRDELAIRFAYRIWPC